MLEIDPRAGASLCPPLADAALNHWFARAVLDGVAPGRLWVDQTASPAAAHVLHSYGMSLIWGPGIDRALESLSEHLVAGGYRRHDEWLQIDPRWAHLDWDAHLQTAPGTVDTPPAGPQTQRFTRVNFRFDRSAFEARHAGSALPQGWSLRPMDEADFDRPGISVTPRAFWRDAAQFLAHGGGVCAVRGTEVGAIAFTSFRFDDILEIGLETWPAYRGLGLARALSAALIRRCLAAGLEPVWSCRKENTGSYLLAQQLGFVPVLELPYYRLPARGLTLPPAG